MRGRRTNVVMAILVAVSLAALPVPVHAHAPARATKVAVLPVVVEGELPTEVREEISAKLLESLAGRNFTPVPARPPGGRCDDAACLHDVAASVGAEFLIVPSLGTLHNDYGIAVRVYARSGALEWSEEATCEICSHPEAVVAIVERTQALVPSIERRVENPWIDSAPATPDELGPARLVVRSVPAGATVRVDGADMGRTPLELTLDEGGLTNLELTLPGYVDVKTTVRAQRGRSEDLEFVLLESDEGQTRALRASGYTLSFLSLPVIGGGVALLVLDGRSYQKDCSGENVDFAGNCRYVFGTAAGGGTMVAVGIVTLVAGMAMGLLAWSRERAKAVDRDFEEDTVRLRPRFGPGGLEVRF